jgi:putative Ca2+/H+ antiporter (TMEM165/GDT1 family)
VYLCLYYRGDRSQIATIALAAAKDPIGVTLGGILGHCICTGIAVIGGRLLASRISEKMVSYVGGAVFLLFAIHSVYFRE